VAVGCILWREKSERNRVLKKGGVFDEERPENLVVCVRERLFGEDSCLVVKRAEEARADVPGTGRGESPGARSWRGAARSGARRGAARRTSGGPGCRRRCRGRVGLRWAFAH